MEANGLKARLMSAKVREALDDPRPAAPHERAMNETQALIDGKRRVRS